MKPYIPFYHRSPNTFIRYKGREFTLECGKKGMKNNKFYIVVIGIVSIIIIAMLDYGSNSGLPFWLSFLLLIITLAGVFTDD